MDKNFPWLTSEQNAYYDKRLQIAHERGVGKLNPGMTREQHQAILYGNHYNGLDRPLKNMPQINFKKPQKFVLIFIDNVTRNKKYKLHVHKLHINKLHVLA